MNNFVLPKTKSHRRRLRWRIWTWIATFWTGKKYLGLDASFKPSYTFVVLEPDDGIKINADEEDTIKLGPDVSVKGGSIKSTSVGDVVTLVKREGQWAASSVMGTWVVK